MAAGVPVVTTTEVGESLGAVSRTGSSRRRHARGTCSRCRKSSLRSDRIRGSRGPRTRVFRRRTFPGGSPSTRRCSTA
jgi:hypothetical protein